MIHHSLLLIASIIFIQPTFLKHIGSAGVDRGVSVIQTNDHGYIVTGYTTSHGAGDQDVLLVRTDSIGDTLWIKTVGGKGSDNGWAIQQTAEGGFLVIGFTDSFGAGNMDIYLIRTNAEGDTLWTKTFGAEGDEFGWDIRQTSDNGFIIAAQTSSYGEGEIDAYLIKIDASGNEEWSRTYGGQKVDRIFSVRQTPDGGYVAAGITYSFGAGDRDAYLLKTDAVGEMEWFKTFGGEAFDVGHAVALTDDGGYLVTGYGESFTTYGKRDVYLIKTDTQGQLQWLKTYGGNENERAMKAEQTNDGGYIVIGFTQSFGNGHWDAYLIKTDAAGESLWTRTFGGSREDTGYTVQPTNDGGYILTGQTYSFGKDQGALLLIKTDHEGKIEP